MGNIKKKKTMKFTSVAIAALLAVNTSAVVLEAGDDCGGKWCNKGLAYDLDEKTLRKAEADNVAKTNAFNGATRAHESAQADHAAAAAADAAAAKTQARKDLLDTAHTDAGYDSKEKSHESAVKTKWSTHDAQLKAADDEVAKTTVLARKARDLDSATAAKAASDANLKSNQDRVAYEKDQLERGENQDRHKFVNKDTAAKTSEIGGKHDERERGNGRLLKSIASF